MHEMSIAESIIQIVLEQAKEKNVKEVHLKVSILEQIVPDSLNFYYDIIKEEYKNLKNSKLLMEFSSLIGKCIECETVYTIDNLFFLCNKCNKGLKIIEGEETYIDKIILEN